MTLAEMRAEVFNRLRENASSPVHFTEDEVDAAINEGLEEIADATEWCERTQSFRLAALRTYYDLRSVVAPEQFLAMRRAYVATGRRWLTPSTPRKLDGEGYTLWESVLGSPSDMIQRGLFWLGVYPRPASDGEIARITVVVAPVDLEDDEDEPDFPVEFHQAAIDYAAYDLLCLDGESKKALAREGPWAAFTAGSKALGDYVDGRGTIDRSGVLGGRGQA